MKHSEMHKLMDDILKEVVNTRDSGQKEYAHDEDNVFANFNRVAHLLEEDRKKVLMTYMLKHVDGIAAYVKGHKSQREDVRGRITDCIVYLMLLWGMVEEEHDTTTKGENISPMRDVPKKEWSKDVGLPLDRGRSFSEGLRPEDNLPKVREERNGIQKHKEMESYQ